MREMVEGAGGLPPMLSVQNRLSSLSVWLGGLLALGLFLPISSDRIADIEKEEDLDLGPSPSPSSVCMLVLSGSWKRIFTALPLAISVSL